MTLVAGSVTGNAAILVGAQTVRAGLDSDPTGVAEAFQVAATASGTASKVTVYLDSGTTATKVFAGIYSDSAGHPGALLAQGSITSPATAAWNDIPLTSASLTSGNQYWIAVLGQGGTVAFRDACCGSGALSETHANRALTSLPSGWSTGKVYHDGPLSAYVSSADSPILAVTPANLSFSGSPGGTDPPAQQVLIADNGVGTVNWSASSDSPWLTATPGIGRQRHSPHPR